MCRETVRSGLCAAATEDAEAQGGTKAFSLPGWGEEEAVNATERRPPLALRIPSERSWRSTPAWPGSAGPVSAARPALAPLFAGVLSLARTRREKPFVS